MIEKVLKIKVANDEELAQATLTAAKEVAQFYHLLAGKGAAIQQVKTKSRTSDCLAIVSRSRTYSELNRGLLIHIDKTALGGVKNDGDSIKTSRSNRKDAN